MSHRRNRDRFEPSQPESELLRREHQEAASSFVRRMARYERRLCELLIDGETGAVGEVLDVLRAEFPDRFRSWNDVTQVLEELRARAREAGLTSPVDE